MHHPFAVGAAVGFMATAGWIVRSAVAIARDPDALLFARAGAPHPFRRHHVAV